MKKKHAAIVLAAGKGTRMKSGRAKVLHNANGKPLAAYPVQRALELGCDPIVVVVGHQGEAVREDLEARFPKANLRFAIQNEQRGTGDAARAAKRSLSGHDGRILILYGDVPLLSASTLRKLIRAGTDRLVAFLTMQPDNPAGYGRVVRNADGEILRIVEDRDAMKEEREIRECNGGIYDCDAAFLWKTLRGLTTENEQGEYYLTDLIQRAFEAGNSAVAVDAPREELAGVNDRLELAWVGKILRQRKNDTLMEEGVTLVDPDVTWIDDDVRIEADVTIEPNVRIIGPSRIKSGTVIGQGSVIDRCEVGAGVTIRPYTIMEESKVGDGAIVGPFARLRPGTVLGEDVRIGNFVETKNTTMAKGAKANHLTYLGDATVGERTNVGAGTITCNYDGVNKLRTTLGSDVFIGSDTQLVAPVTVGDGAYVGAGTTLVSDVPPGSLALSRERQVVKEGWATEKRRSPKVAKRVDAARKGRK